MNFEEAWSHFEKTLAVDLKNDLQEFFTDGIDLGLVRKSHIQKFDEFLNLLNKPKSSEKFEELMRQADFSDRNFQKSNTFNTGVAKMTKENVETINHLKALQIESDET